MRRIKNLILLIPSVFVLLFVSCTPDEMEFARPANLEGPVYQQLVEMGNYSHYLACLDKTEYAAPLSTGGSWTAFVPSDSAFEAFFKENGFSSVDDMPVQRVKDLVKQSLIIDAYNTTILTFYPSGWYAGNSFRKLSQYKDTLQILNGSDYANFEGVIPNKDYLTDVGRGRVKPLTYWLDAYLDGTRNNEMERTDYSFMFPGEENMVKGQMKVFAAHVNKTNIIAENGIIYELDKVIEPRPSQYQNLTSEEYGDKYSIFKSLIDRFGYFRYMGMVENPYTGAIDSSYQIRFNTGITNNMLAFDPSDELMPKLLNNVDRTEANATALMAPTNDALLNYLLEDNEVANNYDSYDEMPLDVVGIFLNVNFFTHYWYVLPSHFNSSYNVGLETVEISEGDIVDRKFCSNGMFVGVNKVYPTKSFSTVYGPMVLDTAYSIMLKAVKNMGLDNNIQGTGVDYTILGIRNNQFVNIPDPNSATRKITVVGYEPDMSVIYMQVTGDADPANNRIYPDPLSSNPSSSDLDYVQETLNDIVLNQIVEVPFEEDNYYQTKKGAFVYVKDGTQLQGGGDIDNKVTVNVEETKQLANGKFLVTDKFINPPTKYTYGALFGNMTSFLKFVWVINGADARLDIPGYAYDFLISFLDLRKTYTLLAPNNAAVDKAVADGVIPNPSPAYLNSLNELDKATAKKQLLEFAKKHVIQHPIPTDGKTQGTFKSLNVTGIVDFAPVYSSYLIGNDYENQSLKIFDPATGEELASTINIVNLLSKRVIIHEIDGYLK